MGECGLQMTGSFVEIDIDMDEGGSNTDTSRIDFLTDNGGEHRVSFEGINLDGSERCTSLDRLTDGRTLTLNECCKQGHILVSCASATSMEQRVGDEEYV